MAIGLKFEKSNQPLMGQSKWWGAPDLPEDWDYPCNDEGDPLTFVCQIRCEDIAEFDTEGLLPHTGMLYFFAQIGEYVQAMDIAEGEHNGLGEWGEDAYKVLEIDRSATDDEVKKAYRRMAMKHHPDKVATLGEDVRKSAEEKFKKISEAYDKIKKERGLN